MAENVNWKDLLKRLAASDVFHVFTQLISSFHTIMVQISEKRDSSNRQ